jgi:hypothetical protein
MRLKHEIPGIRNVAVVPGAAVLTLLRQLRLIGKILELLIVGTDHQAYDLIGALLIEAMLVVKSEAYKRTIAPKSLGDPDELSRGALKSLNLLE